jgi:hypothetical protein
MTEIDKISTISPSRHRIEESERVRPSFSAQRCVSDTNRFSRTRRTPPLVRPTHAIGFSHQARSMQGQGIAYPGGYIHSSNP